MAYRKLLITLGVIGGLVFLSSQISRVPMPGLWSLLDGVGGWLPPTNALVSVHAIWFSIIVPVLIAAVWIWPKLRAPKVALAITGVVILGATVWLGADVYEIVEAGGGSKNVGLRLTYTLLSETDKPILQFVCGSFLVTLFSWRFPGPVTRSSSLTETA